MRPRSYFVMTILLVAAVALPPHQQVDPSSWDKYNVRSPPPYPPPDIGSRNLPKVFFDQYPDLTENQRRYLKLKYQKLHDNAQRAIARKATGPGGSPLPPSPVELDQIKQSIQKQMEATTEQLQHKTTAPPGTPIVRAAAPTMPVAQIERELAELEQKRDELLSRIKEARVAAWATIREVRKVGRKHKKALESMGEVSSDRVAALEAARKEKARAAAELERLALENRKLSPRINELREQLRRAKYYIKKGYPLPDFETDTSPEDENNLAVTVPEGGSDDKQWARGASGPLQDMVHQVLNAGRRAGNNVHFMPYGGVLPKLSAVGI